MQTEWEAIVDITRDNVMEIPCLEGEVVAGDRLRVIIEEVLIDAEEEWLVKRYDEARAAWEADGFRTIPWEQVQAEMEAERAAESQSHLPISSGNDQEQRAA